MKKNVGTIDQIVRFIIGALIIVVGFYYNSWWGLLGLVVLATATFSFCLAYLPFGINTCTVKKKKK
ncbi:MAG: DUF2892 domain-containing protein [Candidatus Dadabacteria bacterium]|nr:DUF2892 domain-containing protein [Candidatus Dadabacteria bacterium]